jgi:uncharacterized SAM-binding protein YcdF (DUF218 family)
MVRADAVRSGIITLPAHLPFTLPMFSRLALEATPAPKIHHTTTQLLYVDIILGWF